jgi:hypothetical protein
MVKKPKAARMSVEETLEAVLEIIGWQAELVRSALRQVRGGRPGVSARRKKPPTRTGRGKRRRLQ